MISVTPIREKYSRDSTHMDGPEIARSRRMPPNPAVKGNPAKDSGLWFSLMERRDPSTRVRISPGLSYCIPSEWNELVASSLSFVHLWGESQRL